MPAATEENTASCTHIELERETHIDCFSAVAASSNESHAIAIYTDSEREAMV